MLCYLIGKISDIKDEIVQLFVNNVGYLINVTNKDHYELNKLYKIYVADLIKEEEELLYGFSIYEEMLLFKKLILVNGIGPRTAMQILKNSNYKEVIYYIKNQMIKSLSSLQGVGNRASQIVYVLANKMSEFDVNLFEYQSVYEALKKLGFKDEEINKVVISLPNGLADDEAIKLALRNIKND